MGVHSQPRKAESYAADHVRRFAPHPGEGDKVFQSCGHLSGEPGVELRSEAYQAPGFRPEEPGGVDDSLKLVRVGASKVAGRGIASEQRRRDGIDPLIGRLGGEHRRGKKLEWRVE